jgi:hypothetical protein
MFTRDPEKAAQRAEQRAEKRQQRAERAAARQAEAQALAEWRRAHPAEKALNVAATLRDWPKATRGETPLGPVLGGSAEFINAGAHKGWTATRLVAGAATLGATAAVTGRKNKGAAVINVVCGNGAVQTYPVTPESSTLRAAAAYVAAFNALADQLAVEASADQ